MIDITLQNFETELVAQSQTQPVLLDIWAPWCEPCKALGPILEKLEADYEGRFKLGKLNADEQPEIAGQLSQMFGVRSIPFCVLFKEGQPVDGFVGALPEGELRTFLDKHVLSSAEAESAHDVQAAGELMAAGDSDRALEKLQEAVAINPANDAARFDYLRALLKLGRVDEARRVYEPVADKVVPDARLAACGHWIAAMDAAAGASPIEQLRNAVASNKRDFDNRFQLAQVLFAHQQFTGALDELLEIIMRDKTWNDELARKTYVAILELMAKPAPAKAEAAPAGKVEVAGRVATAPADPVVDGYRRKLSMALF